MEDLSFHSKTIPSSYFLEMVPFQAIQPKKMALTSNVSALKFNAPKEGWDHPNFRKFNFGMIKNFSYKLECLSLSPKGLNPKHKYLNLLFC